MNDAWLPKDGKVLGIACQSFIPSVSDSILEIQDQRFMKSVLAGPTGGSSDSRRVVQLL